MSDLPDYELHRTPGVSDPVPEPSPRPIAVWIAAGALAAAAAIAAYVAFVWRPAQAPAATKSSTAPAAASRADTVLGGKHEPMTLPPLDATDTLVRTLVQRLSESPAVMAWLPTNGLIRNFTVVVTNVAEGAGPAKQLKVLRPSAPFRVVTRDGGTFVDPRSYDRYNRIADAVSSIDAAGAATLYATLKPRIEDAHRELGGGSQSFDRTLERAIVALLETPVVDAPPRLKPKGIGYAYADERLEDLSAAQKQLLRMGPQNVRVIKARLRDIALALGIPPDRLRDR